MASTLSKKLTSREALAFCLLGGLSASRGVTAPSGVVNERPTKAPAAVAQAQAPAYAFAANGAGIQPQWLEGISASDTASAAEHQTMRAFRGLEPWRDPA